MILTTLLDDIADFWAERGITPEKLYTLDDVTYWQMEVDENHEMLAHPEYVQLVFQEKMQFRNVLRKRMSPVLYSVKKGKHYADVRDPQGNRAVPLSRSRTLLTQALTNPDTRIAPIIIPLKQSKRVRYVLDKAMRSGVTRILFFAAEGFTETFSLEEAIDAV